MQATRKKKVQQAGAGCLVQGVGLLLLFLFPIGTVIGLVLLVVGSQMAIYWTCSACGNRLADKGVLVCPTCKAELS